MIAAEQFLAGRVIPFPAGRSRVPPSFTAFPAGSRNWNVSAEVVDAGSRVSDGQIVIEVVAGESLRPMLLSVASARRMARDLARGIDAAGAEAAQVAVGGVTFAFEEAEGLHRVLTQALRRCEAERKGARR